MAYRDNHITSRCYLAAWAEPGRGLRVVRRGEIESRPKQPDKVGLRKHFWGADGELRQDLEQRSNVIESAAAPVLRDLPDLWPLEVGSDQWQALVYFVALHYLRNPYTFDTLHRLQQVSLDERVREYQEAWSDEQLEQFLGEVTSDRFRAELVMDALPKTASVLGSMHWSLIEFDRPVLATSDQPVTVVPLLGEGVRAPVRPRLRERLLESDEVRMPLSPWRALLMTWLNEPEEGPRFRANERVAARLNRSVIGQADREWFHHPQRRPTTLDPVTSSQAPLETIGRHLIPDYDLTHAIRSQRRRDTADNLDHMIESGVTGEMHIARVKWVGS